MSQQTENLLALWLHARTRFSNQLRTIEETDLKKKLGDSPSTVGFYLRHIADVELLFCKNFLGNDSLVINPKTVVDKADTGEWTNLIELLEYVDTAFETLKATIMRQSNDDWVNKLESNPFNLNNRAEALGRIISHTAYHAGQMAIVIKYGN